MTGRSVDITVHHGSLDFDVERDGRHLVAVRLPLRGVHNVVNATGALALALELGIDAQVGADALAKFGGVARRFDIRGTHGGATFVDELDDRGTRWVTDTDQQRRTLELLAGAPSLAQVDPALQPIAPWSPDVFVRDLPELVERGAITPRPPSTPDDLAILASFGAA